MIYIYNNMRRTRTIYTNNRLKYTPVIYNIDKPFKRNFLILDQCTKDILRDIIRIRVIGIPTSVQLPKNAKETKRR